MHHLIIGLWGTEDLAIINRAWLYKDPKVSVLQANVSLAHMVRHWTPKPVLASGRAPLEVTFFAVVNSFDYKNAISSNFVQTVKISNTDPRFVCSGCRIEFQNEETSFVGDRDDFRVDDKHSLGFEIMHNVWRNIVHALAVHLDQPGYILWSTFWKR